MSRHKVYRGRWLGSVKQTVPAADELNFAYGLRQREIVKSGETDPVTCERQAVPKYRGELGFLRITQAPITEIELAWRMLLRDQETRRLEKGALQVVILQRRLLVQLN